MYKILAHTCTHATAAFRLAVVSCILFLAAAFSLRAQNPTRDAEIRVYYPFDNAVVREDYLSNQEALRQLDSLYLAGAFDGQETLEIVSYSSPEGQYAYNVNLSKRRAESLRRHIAAKYPSLAPRLTTNPDGESWADLREAVLHDTRMSEQSREKMLQIIDSSARPDEKEARLKAISSYKQLYANYFRRLRYAFIRVRIADSGADAVPTGNTEISDADAAKADSLRMIVTVFSDGTPYSRCILPFVKENRFLIRKEKTRSRFSHSYITGSSFFILEFDNGFAPLLRGSRFAASFGANDIDGVEGSDSFVYFPVHNSTDVFHGRPPPLH